MARGNTSTAHVVISMEGQQAVNLMKALQAQAKRTRQELEAMERAGQTDTQDYRDRTKELQSMERAIRANRTAYIDLDKVVKNLGGQTLGQLQKALKECRKQMQNLTADDPKMKRLQAQYRAIDNQIGQITGQWKRQDGAIKSVIKRLAAYVSIYSGFNFIKNQVSSMVTENLKFSDSLADIRKVTGMSAEEVNKLSTAITNLDTRTTTEELHQLAFEAGRLGLKSAEDIMGFVRAGNQIRVALGEDLGEGALLELMKMNEVMGTTKKMGLEQAMLATGSAINTLAASSTASGSQIADFVSRLSGIATQSRITTDELLGLGSASSSLNLETEVAATAFNKFINQIVAKTDVVAKAAGIEFKVLDGLVREGKTMEAVVLTLEALGKKGGLRALNPIMGDLGSNGARLNQVLAAFSKNTDVLRTHLDTATTSFAEATSVTQEYNIKNENAAAILARMRNALKDMVVNSGVTEWLTGVLRSLSTLPETVEKNRTLIVTALTAIGAALLNLKIQLTSFSKIGLARMIVNLRAGFLSIGGIITKSLLPAFKSLFSFIVAHPYLAAATAVGVLVAKIIDARREADKWWESQERLNKLSSEFNEEVGKESVRINRLFTWLNKAEKGTTDYYDAKKTILDNYGKYLTGLSKEIESLEDVAGAYDAITKAALNATKARLAQKGLTEAEESYASNTGDRYKDLYDKLISYGKYAPEQAESFVNRLRSVIDSGAAMPADMQKVIDSLTKKDRIFTTTGGSKEIDTGYSVLAGPIEALRKDKANFDKEVAEIELKYGKLPKLLNQNVEEDDEDPLGGIVPDEDEEEKRRRKALLKAKKQHQAVMAAIETYYQMEKQVVNQQYLDKEISAAEHEQKLLQIEERAMNTRSKAREALLDRPGAMSEWYAEVQQMGVDAVSKTEETNLALENLWNKNLKSIGDALRNFGEGEIDGIWKELETDKAKVQEEQIKMQQEIEGILLKYDYTGKVTDQFLAAMQKLNIFKSQLVNEAGEVTQMNYADMKSQMEKLYTIYDDLFAIDISTEEGVGAFRKAIEGLGVTAVDVDAFRDSLKGLGLTAEEEEERVANFLRLLYEKTVEYGDAMTEAEEKARKRGQKIADARWKKSGGVDRENALGQKGENLKSTTSLYSRVGLASENVATDMEVELYKARMEAALEYRDVVMQTGGDIDAANAKVAESINNLSNVLVEKTMSQLETLKSFMDPLEDFGEALGEAWATDDAVKKQEALKEATQEFVKELGTATKQMIVNWVKQKIQHAITNKAMLAAQKASQKEMTGTIEAGQKAESAIVEAGQGAITEAVTNMGAQALAAKKAQSAESVSTEVAETSAKVPLGIASGAAKTIGELGWWGIPLVAVISALLNGLLSAAMSKVAGLFGGGEKATEAASIPTKLVTGMLTYDSGNVQSVLGNNGKVYSARVSGVSGSGLITSPTLTNVNGQAALVGEEGPELVIGRTTTKALMQDNSGLLRGLIQFDRLHSGKGFRTYDNGNLQQFGIGGDDRLAETLLTVLAPTLMEIKSSLDSSAQANLALRDRLNKPIQSYINKNGRGGLIDEVASGLDTERRMGRSEVVKRLFK